MREDGTPYEQAAAPPSPSLPLSGLLTELAQFGIALKHLFGAQMELLAAEIGLARSAVKWVMLAGLAAMISGVGLGLCLLALAGVALAHWFGSWIWAMGALCMLQLLFLLAAIWAFHRCMRWMSFHATRDQWASMMRHDLRKTGDKRDADDTAVQRGKT